jgi:hypothetical protein
MARGTGVRQGAARGQAETPPNPVSTLLLPNNGMEDNRNSVRKSKFTVSGL